MNVSPWDLDEAPIYWRDLALQFMGAESKGQETLAKRAESRRKMTGKR